MPRLRAVLYRFLVFNPHRHQRVLPNTNFFPERATNTAARSSQTLSRILSRALFLGLFLAPATLHAADCTAPAPLQAKLNAAHTPQNYAELGLWFDQHAQPTCAIEPFRAALKLAPNTPVLLDGLAKTYLAANDTAAALDLLRHAPHTDDLTLDLASAYDKSGNPQQAGDTLLHAVHANPASARLTAALVLFLANHGELDNAYRLAETFAKAHPHDLNAQKGYLRVLVATGDAGAAPLARTLLATAPHDGELLYLNGVLEQKAGESAAARDHLQQSVAQTPNYADSHYQLGLALQQLNDPKAAGEQFQTALKLGLTDPEAHLNLSKTARATGQTELAEQQLKLYQATIQAKTNAEMATTKAADAQGALDAGDPAKAAALYREALEVTPQNAQLHYGLAMALDKAHDLPGERSALEDTVRLDPGNALAQHQLGYLLSQAGDNTGAEAHFREAVRANPSFTQAWISLAATLATRSEFAGARDALNHALHLDPHNAQAQQMLGMLPATAHP